MKFNVAAFYAVLFAAAPSSAFVSHRSSSPPSFTATNGRRSSSTLSMVLEKPKTKAKKLAKIEVLKINSGYLTQPLKDVSLGWGVEPPLMAIRLPSLLHP